jgi:hypothetical protein
MADPLTALIHAVQVMNFLKTLIWKTIKERKEATGAVQASQPCSDSPNDQDEPQMSEHLEKPLVLSSQKDLDFPMRAAPVQVFGAEKALHPRSDEPKKFGVDMDHNTRKATVSSNSVLYTSNVSDLLMVSYELANMQQHYRTTTVSKLLHICICVFQEACIHP